MRQKCILVFLGLFLALVLLELCLRLGGYIFLSFQEQRNQFSVKKKAAYRIMCLGESTTALGGLASYPSQLEEVLNEHKAGFDFSVINKGVPGIETTGILEKLNEWLTQYRPHIVIAMMGINDDTWRWGSVIRRYPKSQGLPFTDIVTGLRLYKFFALLWSSLAGMQQPENQQALSEDQRGKINTNEADAGAQDKDYVMALSCLAGGDYDGVESILRAKSRTGPLSYDMYMCLGWAYECRSRHAEAAAFFREAMDLDSERPEAYYSLGQTYYYQKQYPSAIQMIEGSIARNPYDVRAYTLLSDCYAAQGKLEKAVESYQKSVALNLHDDRAYGGLAQIYQMKNDAKLAAEFFRKSEDSRMTYYDPITCSNYLKLKEELDKRGIALICVQYPIRSVRPLKKIFQGQPGVLFVDNEMSFKQAVKDSSYWEYFTDMFGGDFGHCTNKGNRLLAENIAHVIFKALSSGKLRAAE